MITVRNLYTGETFTAPADWLEHYEATPGFEVISWSG